MNSFQKNIDPQLLESNYTKKQKEEIRHDFSSSEKTELKNQFFALSNNLFQRQSIINLVKGLMESDMDREEIIEALKEIPINDVGVAPIKSLNKNIKSLHNKIHQGYEIKEEFIYGLDDQQSGKMIFYNSLGDYIYDRPLQPSERQTNILSITKNTGTNG